MDTQELICIEKNDGFASAVVKEQKRNETKPLMNKLEAMESEFADVMQQLEQHRQKREDPNAFYVACADYYKDGADRHNSPTKRLISQKNTTVDHKQVFSKNIERSNTASHFYSSPGKSFVIEPNKKEIDYKLAKKDLNKFYEKVFNEEITQHKVKNESPLRRSVTTKVTTRPHLKIMKKMRVAIALMLKNKFEELYAQGQGNKKTTDDILVALSASPVKRHLNKLVQEDKVGFIDEEDKVFAVKELRRASKRAVGEEAEDLNLNEDLYDKLEKARVQVDQREISNLAATVDQQIRKQSS